MNVCNVVLLRKFGGGFIKIDGKREVETGAKKQNKIISTHKE